MDIGLLLGRYLFTHPEKADHTRRRIACIGDSITFGAGVFDTRKTDAWPVILEGLLGKEYQVLNYGVSGATLQKEGDFPYHKFGFLKRMKSAQPEKILLMLGTNDSKPYNWNEKRYAKEYEELIQEFSALPWELSVALLVPPKAFPKEQTGIVEFDIRDSMIAEKIRPLVLELGKRYSLSVIDLYAFLEEHPEYFADGVHPNVLGNRAIAEYLYQEMKL